LNASFLVLTACEGHAAIDVTVQTVSPTSRFTISSGIFYGNNHSMAVIVTRGPLIKLSQCQFANNIAQDLNYIAGGYSQTSFEISECVFSCDATKYATTRYSLGANTWDATLDVATVDAAETPRCAATTLTGFFSRSAVLSASSDVQSATIPPSLYSQWSNVWLQSIQLSLTDDAHSTVQLFTSWELLASFSLRGTAGFQNSWKAVLSDFLEDTVGLLDSGEHVFSVPMDGTAGMTNSWFLTLSIFRDGTAQGPGSFRFESPFVQPSLFMIQSGAINESSQLLVSSEFDRSLNSRQSIEFNASNLDQSAIDERVESDPFVGSYVFDSHTTQISAESTQKRENQEKTGVNALLIGIIAGIAALLVIAVVVAIIVRRRAAFSYYSMEVSEEKQGSLSFDDTNITAVDFANPIASDDDDLSPGSVASADSASAQELNKTTNGDPG
jgi:hypothetical protein